MKHTLPWHLDDSKGWILIHDAECNAILMSDTITKETAQFIVKSANNFYPLLDMCRQALPELSLAYRMLEDKTGMEDISRGLIEKLRLAIKSAEK